MTRPVVDTVLLATLLQPQVRTAMPTATMARAAWRGVVASRDDRSKRASLSARAAVSDRAATRWVWLRAGSERMSVGNADRRTVRAAPLRRHESHAASADRCA